MKVLYSHQKHPRIITCYLQQIFYIYRSEYFKASEKWLHAWYLAKQFGTNFLPAPKNPGDIVSNNLLSKQPRLTNNLLNIF